MASSSFKYPPLDKTRSQIRLLRKLPGPSLRYVLKTFDVSSCPNYYALSYVWGDDEPLNLIFVNGQEFKIRKNLHNALPNLAKHNFIPTEKYSFWWIDAICIDQKDTKERNHQVGMMRNIFCKAYETIAWLGQDEQTSQLMSEINANPFASSFGSLLRNLASNDYFQRMWIVQEFILPLDIKFICNGTFLHWGVLQDSWARYNGVFEYYGDFNPYWHAKASLGPRDHTANPVLVDPLSSTLWWREIYTRSDLSLQWQLRLDRLLNSFLDRKCSDPRDRIFSLLGLLPNKTLESNPIPVDYDMSLEDLFTVVLEHLKQNSIHKTSEKAENPEILFSNSYNARNLRRALNLDI